MICIDQTAARKVAQRYVAAAAQEIGVELEIVDKFTLERGFGWVFFYDSAKHLETGKISDAIAGNAPIIVDRNDGSVHETGTAHPVEHYIQVYERHHTCHPG